ncbi:hypothetical protein ACFLX1_00395 [Chloroflexota bacterium]
MEVKKTFTFNLEIKVEGRDGYYAAITNPFALTAYGDTEEQAEKRAVCAVDLLLDNRVQKAGELDKYLKHRNVKYSVSTEVMRPNLVVKECRVEKNVEALAFA